MNVTTTTLENTKQTVEQHTSANEKTFFQAYKDKIIALSIWALLIAAYFGYASSNDLTPLGAVRQLIKLMQNSFYGPLIFLLIYALRPLIFFSAALLTVASGFLFGPVLGIIYTMIGSNISAMIAYTIGRYFGKDILSEEESSGVVQKYAKRMRENSFETVLTMRFIFLPYDLVNYLGGLLRIDWKAFFLATAVGSLPGTISFVLFGASIEGNFGEELPSLDPIVLAAGATLFVVSLGLSRYFKNRESKRLAAIK